ncbi:stage II sporulation protein GA (sporulation sigma-E factor processing peptidase) [Caldicoprobacter guelmensis]|uniref:sigma-E processing peptidase SpoIIGA n=1 Tax=Caldicoprobacter guelmensis TaxID=1170224 RepID=UPI001957CD85|nr:sigma-E processing peptidase SpoIIGA [Caldicoprobacter guelmensis]MBM7583296.1 stage II sporulation protein GA (sporulation sigma-E factor processing peptidase) [Caldicoprobacter guelmensis]
MFHGVEYRYVDVLWLDNFVMNFSILWITLKVSRVKGSFWRLWTSAGIGALYAIIFFIPGFEVLHSFFLKMALSLVMVLVAFKVSSFKDFLRAWAFFYAVTFVFGGVALGLYFFTQESVVTDKGIFVMKDYPVSKLMVAVLLSGTLMRAMWRFVRLHIPKDQLLYKVKIQLGDKETIVDALLDTGNMLLDPLSKHPVMIVELSKIEDLLPPEVRMMLAVCQKGEIQSAVQVVSQSKWLERVRVIPYVSVGNSNGVLIGLKPDGVMVLKGGEWHAVANVIVGLYSHKLSKDEHYHALVHPEMVA